MKNIESLVERLEAIRNELVQLTDEARKTHSKDAEPLRAAFRKVAGAVQLLEVKVLNRPKVDRQQELKEESGYRETDQTHESYGFASVHRVSGSMRLVGAMADNLPQFIEIRINRSTRIIDHQLHTEHFHPEPIPVVALRMSNYQWAELITSLNTTGVPCTLESILGVMMDPVPKDALTPLEQIAKDVKKLASVDEPQIEKDYIDALDILAEKVSESGLSKKKAEEINTLVRKLKGLVSTPKNTAAWAAQRIAESTEGAISQGKVEMAAALQNLLLQTGIKGLENALPVPQVAALLTEGSES